MQSLFKGDTEAQPQPSVKISEQPRRQTVTGWQVFTAYATGAAVVYTIDVMSWLVIFFIMVIPLTMSSLYLKEMRGTKAHNVLLIILYSVCLVSLIGTLTLLYLMYK